MDTPNPEDWQISLPVYPPETLDNSQVETHSRCPRLNAYQYYTRRAPAGLNYSIGFGIAYHKYRELIQPPISEEGYLTDDIHLDAVHEVLQDFDEPPQEHRKSYLNSGRLVKTLDEAKHRVRNELDSNLISVVRQEDAFDLELGVAICHDCGHIDWTGEENECPSCGSELVRERFGGRMDQIIDWRGDLWVRDFKTTSRMGKTYHSRFDPNNQFSGYTWAAQQLSGRRVEGVVVEVVYNTKRQGPEFHQFITTRSEGQLEQWYTSMVREIAEVRQNYKRAETDGYLAFPQRTLACNDFGGCFYKDACSQDSAWGIEQWLNSYTVYSEWDFMEPEKEEGTDPH